MFWFSINNKKKIDSYLELKVSGVVRGLGGRVRGCWLNLKQQLWMKLKLEFGYFVCHPTFWLRAFLKEQSRSFMKITQISHCLWSVIRTALKLFSLFLSSFLNRAQLFIVNLKVKNNGKLGNIFSQLPLQEKKIFFSRKLANISISC